MTNKMLDNKTGHLCETLALIFLMMKGYVPVAKNYVTGRGTGAGEVDLIVRRGKMLVFVEVKKRPSFTAGLHAITIENQTRVIRASAAFLARHPRYANMNVRYDAVILVPWKRPKHLQEAWRVL